MSLIRDFTPRGPKTQEDDESPRKSAARLRSYRTRHIFQVRVERAEEVRVDTKATSGRSFDDRYFYMPPGKNVQGSEDVDYLRCEQAVSKHYAKDDANEAEEDFALGSELLANSTDDLNVVIDHAIEHQFGKLDSGDEAEVDDMETGDFGGEDEVLARNLKNAVLREMSAIGWEDVIEPDTGESMQARTTPSTIL
ncbi:hypothetical protein PInf_010485 [Phytophthora infestans]|nr:hypothetical protein PInf_010485 [Phytophthora infestans]